MLSPRWQGLWGGDMNRDGLPLAYNTKGMTKAIILLTDGDNNLVQDTYTAYGPTMTSTQLGVTQCNGTNNCKPGINRLDSRTSELCRNMKDTNIIIYTVALGEEISSKGLAILQDCASSPKHFFLSPTTSELEGVFEQIAETLVKIRVSQ